MLYSGIDLHKRTLAIHTLDAAGALIRKGIRVGVCPVHRERRGQSARSPGVALVMPARNAP